MSIEVVLAGALEKEQEREAFSEYLKSVCAQNHVHIEDYDTYLMMDICPEGFVECSYEGTYVSIAAQTNVAGPGFHAFVCEFFDAILQESPISFDISDPTKYYEERDFENLKYQYFYRWLADIATYIQEHHQELQHLCISWPTDHYQPIGKMNHVVTPMGYIPVEDFAELDIEELAQRFFIWNEQSFTAAYYRNCALSLLWKEGFYEYSGMNEYSDKMGNMIIDYMEAAYDTDDQIALPMDAYQCICEALQREEIIQHATREVIEDLGYRRDRVTYPFGNWSIMVPGCSEQSYDGKSQTLHFMAPYRQNDEGWSWLIKANAFLAHKTPEFAKLFEESEDALERFDISNERYEGKGLLQQSEDYFMITCQYLSGQDVLFLEALIHDEADIPTVKEWLLQVEHHELVSEGDEVKS